ncbi:fumarylacetoacetate hydrolase family protein [Ktedonobacter racemifer]|uniref:Fumarylacetoacetate (FAA) hydrolase n=1 Tax=Ktedonobacter racemifer DSM 44963 TaxID=485913 RepID=D6U2C6_KTERA|nr:fumarylacetoacetate hydrolase family protein [Ktedonobacter racemifer]EFH82794.1 fumarylacetoacetate (FAA) hydrolase [Ktedonobacter racemifer DSM 44963]
MKLVTFRDKQIQAGVVRDERIIPLPYPSLLELLQDPHGMTRAREALAISTHELPIDAVKLLAPIPEPPTLRDFYAFEQHVKAGRATRGLEMIPEWYQVPTFYFSNTSEIYGPDEPVPYPTGSQELDIELEIACVIGREGKNIPVEEAESYIAGYTIMNDWSARDFQRLDMKLNLGPGKGKDFATSLGPWLVTPDELAERRSGSGESERYDMAMLARINGQEISRGNFQQIYYSFPQMIAYASRNARLRPGDVIGSGTVGTGCLLEIGTSVHPWFQPGETIELEIEGIGILRNTIV